MAPMIIEILKILSLADLNALNKTLGIELEKKSSYGKKDLETIELAVYKKNIPLNEGLFLSFEIVKSCEMRVFEVLSTGQKKLLYVLGVYKNGNLLFSTCIVPKNKIVDITHPLSFTLLRSLTLLQDYHVVEGIEHFHMIHRCSGFAEDTKILIGKVSIYSLYELTCLLRDVG